MVPARLGREREDLVGDHDTVTDLEHAVRAGRLRAALCGRPRVEQSLAVEPLDVARNVTVAVDDEVSGGKMAKHARLPPDPLATVVDHRHGHAFDVEDELFWNASGEQIVVVAENTPDRRQGRELVKRFRRGYVAGMEHEVAAFDVIEQWSG